MANYTAKFLTNYFSVTDDEKFKNLVALCQADDEIEIYEKQQPNGSVKYGIGCEKNIHGIPEEGEEYAESIGFFYKSLQELIPSDDAVIITEIGNEKLNYFVACCIVITRGEIKSIDARSEAVKLAADMLKNPNFTTELDY